MKALGRGGLIGSFLGTQNYEESTVPAESAALQAAWDWNSPDAIPRAMPWDEGGRLVGL